MQNEQSAAEIQQRVINLVELYRTKVGKESQIAKDAKEEKDYWDEVNLDAAIKLHKDGMKGPIGFDLAADMPEEWVNTLRVNYHLLGHFYSVVAGNDADKEVLAQFLADYYDSSIFTPEEEEFLRSHFKEMVNYITQTPCDNLDSVNHHDGKDWQLIPNEVLQLIRSRVKIPAGSIIYNPFTGFAQIPLLFSESKFLCEDSYASYNKRYNTFSEKCLEESNIRLGKGEVNLMTAWMKIVLFANSIDSTVIVDSQIPVEYDAVISFIPWIPNAIPEQAYELDFENPSDAEIINKLTASYDNLPKDGILALILPKKHLWASNSYYSLRPLWEQMIKDNSLEEIIQLPSVMSINNLRDDFCIIIAKKGRKGHKTTLIDARFAAKKTEHKNYDEILDLSSFEEMFKNCGIEAKTGLRKMTSFPTEQLNVEILVPQVYVVEKPLDEEKPLPLSKLGALASTRVRSLKFNLPEDTPWVELNDLSHSFKGELDVTTIKKAECPNNPEHVEGSEDYAFSKSGNFIDDFWTQAFTKKGRRVYDYRSCTYLDGSKDVVLFRSSQSGVGTAVVRGTNTPIAVGLGIKAFVLKDGVDALTLVALLRLPIVHRQILAYTEFGLDGHLDDILVPTDKRILYDEKQRLLTEQKMRKSYEDELETKKTEYINEVRMRKHDIGQYIFELVNIEGLMRYYLDNRETEKDFLQQMESLLDNFRSSLGELSTLLDNLSKEEQFGDPETFNMTEFLSGLEKRYTKDSFRIQYTCDLPSIKKYNKKKQQAELDSIADQMMEEDMKQQAELDAIADQMMEEDMKQQAELDAIADQMMEEDMKQQAELDAVNEQMMMEEMKQQAELDAVNEQMMMEDQKRQADAEITLTMSSVIGRDNGISTNANMYIPPIYVAPNDFKRLVNNILNNAKKHGFTNPNKKDYVVQINASIDVESSMYRIDFRNNGNPLPEGMNKMRYGIKGEKAGKTAGTGLGGNYVKSFVEHYGGDYDIFMEDGWTVVRIFLPIK